MLFLLAKMMMPTKSNKNALMQVFLARLALPPPPRHQHAAPTDYTY